MSGFVYPPMVKERHKWLEKPFYNIRKRQCMYGREKRMTLHHPKPENSLASIARNEEDRILYPLSRLAEFYKKIPAEVVGIDNDFTDDTVENPGRLGIRYFFQKKAGAGHAHQLGPYTKSGYIVTGDADSVFVPDWSIRMTRPLSDSHPIAVPYSIPVLYDKWMQYPLELHTHQYLNKRLHKIKRPHLNCTVACMALRRRDAPEMRGYHTELIQRKAGMHATKINKIGTINMISDRKSHIYECNLPVTDRWGHYMYIFDQREKQIRNQPDDYKSLKSH